MTAATPIRAETRRAPTLRRYVNAACSCLDPEAALGACACDGWLRRSLAEGHRAHPVARCPRCDRERRPTVAGGPCLNCLAELDQDALRVRAGEGSAVTFGPRFACAWCGVVASDLVGRDGLFLCDRCVSFDLFQLAQTQTGDPDAPLTLACSFCKRVPYRGALVAGPEVFLCDRCFETACKLRRRDQRDLYDRRDLHCSFDGKSLRELRELYVSEDGFTFCDECTGLIEEVLRDAVHTRLFGLRLADADDRCAWCGAGRDESALVRARRGHAFCASCITSTPRVGRWCGRCGVPSWRTQGVVDIGGAAWCVGCVRREARVAALIVTEATRAGAR